MESMHVRWFIALVHCTGSYGSNAIVIILFYWFWLNTGYCLCCGGYLNKGQNAFWNLPSHAGSPLQLFSKAHIIDPNIIITLNQCVDSSEHMQLDWCTAWCTYLLHDPWSLLSWQYQPQSLRQTPQYLKNKGKKYLSAASEFVCRKPLCSLPCVQSASLTKSVVFAWSAVAECKSG